MNTKILGLILMLWCSHSLANTGNIPKEQQLAINYIDAFTSQNYPLLASYYSRDSVFNDRTAKRKYTGKRHIMAFLERAHKGVLEYRFNIEHMFNSGALVVLIGNYHYKGPGEQFGKPGRMIDIAVPGVTTLTLDMKTRRVKEHQDLIDYQTMADQLSTQ